MRLDYTGAEQFLAYLDGRIPLAKVLEHPAYQTVMDHAKYFSNGIRETDVEEALAGNKSYFYGLESLQHNISRIRDLLSVIQVNEKTWVREAESVLSRLFPGENLDITVYPIIGYDMGIGWKDAVCMNLNHRAYIERPLEFLFFIIHECTHVIYGRHHAIPPLKEVITPAYWLSYFGLWLQNEGYAVYAPLHLREDMGYLDERDYRVLSSPDELDALRLHFLQDIERLHDKAPLARDEYLDICFGEHRITYRIGCEIIRLIEQTYGMAEVQKAFRLNGELFLQKYKHLVEL